MDEQEKIDRRAHVRLIITEALMFLAVLALVGFLTLVVMGYSFNLRGLSGSGEVVERSGLVQISSAPAGATIFIDGEAPLLLSTNASRTMLSGEHEISLEKDGYLGWKKTIKVSEGMMYRLNYPRLLKAERETEEVLEFLTESGEVRLVSVSPNHEKMVVLIDRGLYVLNLNENKLEMKTLRVLDAAGVNVKLATVSGMEWSGNSERLLLQANGEWVVVNVRNEKETVWLGEILASCVEKQGSVVERSALGKCDEIEVSDLKFESEAGDRLLILTTAGELREANVREKKLSEAIAQDVLSFDNDGERVVYLTKNGELMAYRVGEEEGHLIAEVAEEAKFATMRYFQESYVGVASEGKFMVYRKTGWVVSDEEMEEVFSKEVKFKVTEVKKRGKGMVFELVGANGEDEVFDIEAMALTAVDVTDAGWMDEYLRYRIKDGKLSVMDYDGLNERGLVNAEVLAKRTVAISGNGRWLYYFVRDEKAKKSTEKLVREKIN